MKKFLCLLLTLGLLLVMSGCGGGGDGLSGSGTETDPYIIDSAEDLFAMAARINNESTRDTYAPAHYRLSADIDLGGKKWEPIDGCELGFEGVFDGGGHTISGLKIDYKDPLTGNGSRNLGLFGLVKGTVKNLTLSDSTVTVKSGRSPYTAALVGSLRGGLIENCHTTSTVSVTSSFDAAGIVCNTDDTARVTDCTNAASVTGTTNVANVAGVGVNIRGPLARCSNAGAITSQAKAGGVAVSIYAGAEDCTNSGTVQALDNAGGITVHFDDGALNQESNDSSVTLLRCVNTGNVTSSEDLAAGIAVGCRTGRVQDCENKGTIEGKKDTGGILAFFQISSFGNACAEFTVSGCVNSGSVTSIGDSTLYPAGGICGRIYQAGTAVLFENCENSAPVVSAGACGGILGYGWNNSLTLTESENYGKIDGYRYCGGLVGMVRSSGLEGVQEDFFTAKNCGNFGDVYSGKPYAYYEDSYAAGILGAFVEDEGLTYTVTMENCANSGRLDGNRDGITLYVHDLCGTYLVPQETE